MNPIVAEAGGLQSQCAWGELTYCLCSVGVRHGFKSGFKDQIICGEDPSNFATKWNPRGGAIFKALFCTIVAYTILQIHMNTLSLFNSAHSPDEF